MSDSPVSVEFKLPGEHLEKSTVELLEKAFGPAVNETGSIVGDLVGIVGDKVRAWRYWNRIEIAKITHAKLITDGVGTDDIKAIPLNEISSVIEGISNADGPAMSDLWAGLIASALNPKDDLTANRAFTSTLNQMTNIDALVFSSVVTCRQLTKMFSAYANSTSPSHDDYSKMSHDDMLNASNKNRQRLEEKFTPAIEWINDHLSQAGNIDQIKISIVNLERIGLVAYGSQPASTKNTPRLPSTSRRQDTSDIARHLNDILESISDPERVILSSKKTPVATAEKKLPAFYIHPTDWGKAFAEACKIAAPKEITDELLVSK